MINRDSFLVLSFKKKNLFYINLYLQSIKDSSEVIEEMDMEL